MRIVRGWAQPKQDFGTWLWLFGTGFRDASVLTGKTILNSPGPDPGTLLAIPIKINVRDSPTRVWIRIGSTRT